MVPERRGCDRISVHASSDMATGEDEFELPGARRSKECNGAALESACTIRIAVVVFDLFHHGLRVLFAVQPHEDVTNQTLLVFVKRLANDSFCDVPVVVDLLPQRILKIKRHQFFLVVQIGRAHV